MVRLCKNISSLHNGICLNRKTARHQEYALRSSVAVQARARNATCIHLMPLSKRCSVFGIFNAKHFLLFPIAKKNFKGALLLAQSRVKAKAREEGFPRPSAPSACAGRVNRAFIGEQVGNDCRDAFAGTGKGRCPSCSQR
jgi:hypothetical protein